MNNFKYTAIIIEPRKHKALEFVLNNICKCLSNEWKVILFHGKNNEVYSKKIVKKINKEFNERIELVNLNISNLNLIEYSKFLATKSVIFDFINTEMFLVFQTDSMIFIENSHLIDLYLKYDYVGSPWIISNYFPTANCNFIGNGGFSIRNKNKMLEIINKFNWNELTIDYLKHEDLFFCTNYENIYVKKPEYMKACEFCVDEVFSNVTFACHKPWVHSHYEQFKNLYPECEILKNLQYVEEEEEEEEKEKEEVEEEKKEEEEEKEDVEEEKKEEVENVEEDI